MILVTGGTGLVGSHLLLELVQSQESIRAIYRSKESLNKTKKVFEAYNQISDFDKIEWQQADLLDYFSLKDQMGGITKIYHAAATVSFASKDAEQMMRVNIDGTAHLVNLALEHEVLKFCFVSSVAALGSYASNKCTDENALWQKTDTTSNYSISKYYAENEVWRASEEGLPVAVINPATIIGYGDWTESSSTIIKKVADGLSFYPPGTNGFVGVKDVVKAMTYLMNSEITNKRYLLVSENLSYKTLLTLIAESMNKKPASFSVSKPIASLMMVLDQIRALLTAGKPTLTKETLETAFKKKCFSADKIKQELGFEFEPMKKVIENSVKHY
jgi:nucleoside-diphosphate-sugar epimerase